MKFCVNVRMCLQFSVLFGNSFSGSRIFISRIIIGVIIVFYILLVLKRFQNIGLLECFGFGLIILGFLLVQGNKQDYDGGNYSYCLEIFDNWFWIYFFVFYNDIGCFWCQFKLGFGVQQSCCQSDQVNDYNNWVL